uniref:Uncharacterized protein n=1 Tax=mine drainage metagenome TaxID=410659 RepID=E6PTU8_9ZZZZ
MGRHAVDNDDPASAAALQVGDGGTDGVERAENLDTELLHSNPVASVEDAAGSADTRVRDDAIKAAELLRRAVNGCGNDLGVPDVGGVEQQPAVTERGMCAQRVLQRRSIPA